jgi:hypothetical protein
MVDSIIHPDKREHVRSQDWKSVKNMLKSNIRAT